MASTSNRRPAESYLDQAGPPDISKRPRGLAAAGLLVLALSALGLVFGVLALAYLAMSLVPPDTKSQAQVISEARARAARAEDHNKRSNSILLPRDQQNHFYRENDQAGTLFIITGMAENDYPESRAFILLKASLLSPAGEVLAAGRVYAGNLISQDELKSLPLAEISARLKKRGGPGEYVLPGQAVPFMIVFNHQPDGVIEYQVETLESEPVRPGGDGRRPKRAVESNGAAGQGLDGPATKQELSDEK